MRIFGLTGGIGSGKSTVAAYLGRSGFEVIDADEIARYVVEPGTAALLEIVGEFGTSILDASGALDRAKLASIVFYDSDKLQLLNSITHPAIGVEIARRIGKIGAGNPDGVVLLDIPLLVEGGGKARYGLEALIVVDCDPAIALERIVANRDITRQEALARINSQVSREVRLGVADYVLDNSSTKEDLLRQVEDLVDLLDIA
ncbi:MULTISPECIES: dephospho-CoA kinase [Acidithrix]|uniref:Dephospho-CoA kinase n=1 Tax=Acidithrix ferrooxidans TaxID=1280514 RepID=A0A0D8HH38_9ACTN|nr:MULTISPECIES: dephospho-CoA kinase [Acidithrix]KJF17092.1 dephospho-CoA kinase [Acidithrix ferrooxidans]CAG4923406.1 unnamed protein product [Acidithrix sp. C25]